MAAQHRWRDTSAQCETPEGTRVMRTKGVQQSWLGCRRCCSLNNNRTRLYNGGLTCTVTASAHLPMTEARMVNSVTLGGRACRSTSTPKTSPVMAQCEELHPPFFLPLSRTSYSFFCRPSRATRSRTLAFTSSLISRTVSLGSPLGFSTAQSSVRSPGMLGLASPANNNTARSNAQR